MFQTTTEIAALLKERGIKYELAENDKFSTAKVGINTKHCAVVFHFISTNDSGDFAMRIFGLLRASEEKRDALVRTCNALNRKFRFVKFIVAEDGMVNVEFDLPAAVENPAQAALEILQRTLNILEEAYPELMRTMWAE